MLKTAPLLLHESSVHADRSAKLAGGVGKAMHDRTEGEMASRVDVTGLDPAAGRGDEAVRSGRSSLAEPFHTASRPSIAPRCRDVSGEADRSQSSSNQVTTSPLTESTKRWPRRNPLSALSAALSI